MNIRNIVIVAGSLAVVGLSVKLWCEAGSYYVNPWRHVMDLVLSELSESYIERTMLLKSAFTGSSIAGLRPVDGHTHGQSAAMRGSASLLIDRVAAGAGLKAVYYQSSRADSRNGREGVRTYFWAKDHLAAARNQEQDPLDLVAMVDVDYYVDMPTFMVDKFVPLLLYTFVPAAAAAVRGDYKYTFTETNEVRYLVNGGGLYEHELWDWSGDSVSVDKWFLGIIPLKRAIYAIERRQLDVDHQLILLAPLRKWVGPHAVVLSWMLASCKRLARIHPVVGDFVRLLVNDANGVQTSTSAPGSFLAATVPSQVDDAIKFAATTTANKLTAYTVKSKMEKDAGTMEGFELLHAYYLQEQRKSTQVDILEPSGVRRFQWISKKGYDPDVKPSMVPFMDPIIDGAFAPDRCYANDERAVQKRIEALRKQPQTLGVFESKVMDEYVELFWGFKRWQEVPMENEDVYERQPRKSQRRILDEAQHGKPTDLCKQMTKGEAYPNVNDPRVISTINGPDKMAFSAFSYVVAERQKQHPWYAFGKTPDQIATRVAELCQHAKVAAMTDCSRMDGNYDERANELHRRIFGYGFLPMYHVQLFELMNRMIDMRSVTTFGYKSKTGQAEASGKASTAVDNSNLNAFMAFLGYRKTVNPWTRTYYTKYEAWDKLGIYGGDDGLSTDFSKEMMLAAAESMGQVLKLEELKRGQRGIMFLARRYGPDVWHGDPTSTCDLPRQLSKFHVTTCLPSNITREQKLCEKAFAFYLTDKNTPVIGPFVKRVKELFPELFPHFQNVTGIWLTTMESEHQYPNEYAGWMEDDADMTLHEFDRKSFAAWLLGTDRRTIFHVMQCAPPIEPVVKSDSCVVDGHEVKSRVPVIIMEVPKDRAPTRKQTRPRKPKGERSGSSKIQLTLKAPVHGSE